MSSNPNTKINEIRENINSEYAEELKLNIPCDEDEDHFSVLYCIKCETNLCEICSKSIHLRKAISKHEIVRLTEKPEPPVYCHLHPKKIAELICKDCNCKWANQPICTMCHQYETHKDHKYGILDNEYDRIQRMITSCLKEISTKKIECDKNLDKFDKWSIPPYNSTDGRSFIESERDKIDSLYILARTLALKKIDDYVNHRTETLNFIKNQYKEDKIQLESLNSRLRSIEKMQKLEVVTNGDNALKLITKAETILTEPIERTHSINCSITLPKIETLISDVKVNFHLDVIPQYFQRYHQKIIPAVCFVCKIKNYIVAARYNYDSENIQAFKKNKHGYLVKLKDNRVFLTSRLIPNPYAIGLKLYEHIAVMKFLPEDKGRGGEELLNEQIKNAVWTRIILLLMEPYNEKLENRVRELAKVDKRVEVWLYENDDDLIDFFFQ